MVRTAAVRKSVAHRILNRLAMIDSVPGTDLQIPSFPSRRPVRSRGPRPLPARAPEAGRAVKVDGKGRAQRNELPGIPIDAAGGLVSTVRDLARLDAGLDSGVLLAEDTLAAAWSTAAERDGVPSRMGLGWFVQSYKGERIVWNFGYIQNAYSSLIVKVPARGLTFILLANSDGLSAPFQLQSGDVTKSLFATLFLRLAI
jgi:CubicO group peptidase (beta-lactamase class C family)